MAKIKKQESRAKKGSDTSSPLDAVETTGGSARALTFNEHDLSLLPPAALPFVDGVYKGKHSYTVCIDQAVALLHLAIIIIAEHALIYINNHGSTIATVVRVKHCSHS